MDESSTSYRPDGLLRRSLDHGILPRVWPYGMATLISVGQMFTIAGTTPCSDTCLQTEHPIALLAPPAIEVQSTVSVAPPAVIQSAYSTGTVVHMRGTAIGGPGRAMGLLKA
jgi:hypothetical protein